MATETDKSLGVYALADRCGVDIGEACDHAAIARSTPSRWRSGVSAPRASRVVRLRRSILLIAESRGTLPADLVEEAAALGSISESCAPSVARLAIKEIRRQIDVLEAALTKEEARR